MSWLESSCEGMSYIWKFSRGSEWIGVVVQKAYKQDIQVKKIENQEYNVGMIQKTSIKGFYTLAISTVQNLQKSARHLL